MSQITNEEIQYRDSVTDSRDTGLVLYVLQHTPGVLPLHPVVVVLQARGLFVTFALFILVRLDVLRQVVAPHEPLATVRTHEALLPGVSPQVSLQLVRAGEALPAEQPVAHERPLPGVPPQVRLQVRRLPVNLPAARDVADVLLLLARLVVGGGGRLAVGTPAPPAPPGGRQRGLGVLQQRGDLRLVLRKVRMSEHQAPLQLEPVVVVVAQGGRVAHMVVPTLLQAPPRDVLPAAGVGGLLLLLLVVHEAGGSRDEAGHGGGGDGGRRCVRDRGDVGGGAGGLHGAGEHLDRGEVIGVRGVCRRGERLVGAEGALDELGLGGR